ncbi:MAG TPA: ATP-binding protein, partial [Polyangiaceae bacterium]
MPFYRRFDKLPDKSTTVETAVLDLKETYAPDKSFEMAKDVAAFANHLGGTLLIGAKEVDGKIGEYNGVPPELAEKIRTGFSLATKERCSPRPIYDFSPPYPAPGDPTKEVFAVFVEP